MGGAHTQNVNGWGAGAKSEGLSDQSPSDTTSHPLAQLQSDRQMVTSAGRDAENVEPSHNADGNVIWHGSSGKEPSSSMKG